MKLSAPSMMFWTIAVVLGVLGLLGFLMKIPFVTAYAFWFEFFGFAVLAVATAMKGM